MKQPIYYYALWVLLIGIPASPATVGAQALPVYQIIAVSGQQLQQIQLVAKINPNPVRESLVLTIAAADLEKKMTYILTDSEGRILLQDRLVKTSTLIDVSRLKTGTYFIKIVAQNRQLKSFRVLKAG